MEKSILRIYCWVSNKTDTRLEKMSKVGRIFYLLQEKQQTGGGGDFFHLLHENQRAGWKIVQQY